MLYAHSKSLMTRAAQGRPRAPRGGTCHASSAVPPVRWATARRIPRRGPSPHPARGHRPAPAREPPFGGCPATRPTQPAQQIGRRVGAALWDVMRRCLCRCTTFSAHSVPTTGTRRRREREEERKGHAIAFCSPFSFSGHRSRRTLLSLLRVGKRLLKFLPRGVRRHFCQTARCPSTVSSALPALCPKTGLCER